MASNLKPIKPTSRIRAKLSPSGLWVLPSRAAKADTAAVRYFCSGTIFLYIILYKLKYLCKSQNILPEIRNPNLRVSNTDSKPLIKSIMLLVNIYAKDKFIIS